MRMGFSRFCFLQNDTDIPPLESQRRFTGLFEKNYQNLAKTRIHRRDLMDQCR